MDIVVLYCNDSDEKWKRELKRNMEREISEHNRREDGQVVSSSRYRDWGLLKYWFRGIEKNCDRSIERVFLVVAGESQVPKWLNVEHPKLRVVYHREFVPEELLPTFNSNTIQFYISRIEELGEEFLISDDDCYILKPIDKCKFFKDGKPVKDGRVRGIKFYEERGYDKTFMSMINNNIRFMQRECNYLFYPDHLIKNRLKSYERYLLEKYHEEIYESLKVSRFRHPRNYTTWLYDDLFRLNGVFVQGEPYSNSLYVNLTEDVNLLMCDDKDMVCLNDTSAVKDYLLVKRKVTRYLDGKFPKKSSYEV